MHIPSPDPERTVLYHGTFMPFKGVPTYGMHDALDTGYPSATPHPDLSDKWAGSDRHSRIYSVEIPTERVLDLIEESRDMMRRDQWGNLGELIKQAGREDDYSAVAIQDITSGGKYDTEFRIVNPPDETEWRVGPATSSAHISGYIDNLMFRLDSGERITQSERNLALEQLSDYVAADMMRLDRVNEIIDRRWLDENQRGRHLNALVNQQQALMSSIEQDSNLIKRLESYPSKHRYNKPYQKSGRGGLYR